MSDRVQGFVKFFDFKKGFGFITPVGAADEESVFVHFSAINGEGFRTLAENQRVEFEVVETEKGLSAQDVVVV